MPASFRPFRLLVAYAVLALCISLGFVAFVVLGHYFTRVLYFPPPTVTPMLAFPLLAEVLVSVVLIVVLLLAWWRGCAAVLSPEEMARLRSQLHLDGRV